MVRYFIKLLFVTLLIFPNLSFGFDQGDLDRLFKTNKCSFCDLNGADLIGAKLKKSRLKGADLSGADLSGADLSGANLAYADLTGANLTGANLDGANLDGANLKNITNPPKEIIKVKEKFEQERLAKEKKEKERLAQEKLAMERMRLKKVLDSLFQTKKCVSCDLTGANLTGAILTGADLTGSNLNGADLTGANLSEANLYGVKLKDANLSNANLKRTNLIGTKLTGANLIRANLTGANLTRADLSGSNLTETNLSYANLERTKLLGVNLTGANLKNITNPPKEIIKAQEKFEQERLAKEKKEKERLAQEKLAMERMRLQKVLDRLFQTKKCPGCDLTKANLKGANLTYANLKGANLKGANLTKANLTGANLKGANLTGANLKGANLTRTGLSGANLRMVDLKGANLYGSNLTGANLTYADLTGANLSYANLARTKLLGGKLNEAKLIGTNLKNIKNPPKEIIKTQEKLAIKKLRNKINRGISNIYLTTDKKLDLFKEVYNHVQKNKNLHVELKNDVALLFSKIFVVPLTDSKDLMDVSLKNLSPQVDLLNKLITKIPNKTILMFRELILGNYFITKYSDRSKIIKNIDKFILSKIKSIKMYGYGSERDASGLTLKVDLSYSPLIIAKNIDTNIRLEGYLYIPSGLPTEEFKSLFKLKYDTKFLDIKLKNGNEISWSDSRNIVAVKKSGGYDGSFKKSYELIFGTTSKLLPFKGNRKVYYPMINGSGFSLVELDAPTLAECMNALTEGVKFNDNDYFFKKGIYRFSIGKFGWTGNREFFNCERYGVSTEDQVYYNQTRMVP